MSQPPVEPPQAVRTDPVRASTELRGKQPAHPYLTARNLRVDRYLDLAKALANYRLLALLLLVVDVGLVAVVVWQSHQTRIVPYVVRLDGYGNAVAFGPADRLADPDRALKVHEIARWVRNVRTITLDPQVQRRLILDAYAYTDQRAVGRLNNWYRAHPPFERARDGSVSIQVTSVLSISEADRTWQVQWLETYSTPGGTTDHQEPWQALITLEVDPPERIEEVVTNPLGIRVIDFDWTRLPSDPKGTP